MLYTGLKFLHVLGVILLLGNVTVTAVWKVFADRTQHAPTVAYAQRLVIGTDWALTGGGIVLTMVGGYGMVLASGMDLLRPGWLLWSQVLFALSGCVWLLVLVPIQGAQARLSRRFVGNQAVPAAYSAMGRRWLLWGVLGTMPLVAALYLMVAKPW